MSPSSTYYLLSSTVLCQRSEKKVNRINNQFARVITRIYVTNINSLFVAIFCLFLVWLPTGRALLYCTEDLYVILIAELKPATPQARAPGLWIEPSVLMSITWCWPRRRHGSTRVQGYTFLAWRSSWRMVVYIYFMTAVGNSVSSQLGSFCQGNRYCTEKAGGTARPPLRKSHLPDHSPTASRRVGLAF